MSRSFLLLPLLLTACTVADRGTDTGTESGCDAEISTTIPTSGAVNADYRAAVEFKLSKADTTATVTSDIQGTTSVNKKGDLIIFTPDEPLTPSTQYTVTLNYCRGASDLTFTTSSAGTPLEDVSILQDRTYALALGDARIVEPPGIGALIGGYLTQTILFGVQAVSDTEILMIGSTAVPFVTPPVQDYCSPTIPFPPADFTEQPFFSIGPQTLELELSGASVYIGDLQITGTFAADGSRFTGGTFSGIIDTRPLASAVAEGSPPGAICDIVTAAGIECIPCPNTGEPFCLALVADQIEAPQVDIGPLVTVTHGDCPGCETTPPEPEAVCPDPV